MRQPHHFLDVVDGSHGIGGVAHGHDAGAGRHLSPQLLHIQRAIGGMDVHKADHAAAFFQRRPGRNIGVVVEPRHDDFIPRREFPAEGAAQREGQRGHVGAKNNFLRIAAQQVGHGRMRSGDNLIGAPAGGKRSMRIGVGGGQVPAHRVNHALRHLRASRAVEERGGVAIHFHGECGELRPDPIDVKRGHERLLWERSSCAGSGEGSRGKDGGSVKVADVAYLQGHEGIARQEAPHLTTTAVQAPWETCGVL